MMKVKNIMAGLAAAMLSVSALYAGSPVREYREILRLQENGMHGRSRHLFSRNADRITGGDNEGMDLLNWRFAKANREFTLNEYKKIIDLKGGLVQALDVLKDIDGLSIIRMTKRDIVRHKLVTRVVEAYEQFEQKNKKTKENKKQDEQGINKN